jgi:hypothetical protein
MSFCFRSSYDIIADKLTYIKTEKLFITGERKGDFMICKSCGRTIDNENSNFCFYCGTSLKEGREGDFVSGPVSGNQEYSKGIINSTTIADVKDGEKPLSMSNWLGSMMLPFIPIIGGIAYIIMLVYWGFGGKAPASKKNWARASLIVIAVSLILLVFYFSVGLQQLEASGFDVNSYMQQFIVNP